ncbi:MAG: hypothetical protein KAX69_00235 [Chitinophagales bacterium]|jgi:hypothetical protein|nr:hypothetical protein [Chitinophagales bacterium]MBP9213415.1 hypothetical protein [Chitinophagaceae bacterium]
MCTVSDKIKFCTCPAGDARELNHYWILHRKNKGKNLMLIGEPVFEHYKELSYFEPNNNILCNRLNETDAFDIPMDFKEKDQFEIVFNNHGSYDERITHCFVYKKGKWIITEYDVFSFMNKFDETDSGIIENPFVDTE